MSRDLQAVHAAIERWEARGLVSPELAERLRAEVDHDAEEGTRRLSQYVLAGTAGVLVLLAGGVFLEWAWPLMGDELRAAFLAVAGMGIHFGGARLEWRRRWLPASWLMQASGLGLVLFALAFSEEAWPDHTFPAFLAGGVALAWALAASVRAIRRSAFMPAVHLVALLAYVALFLERATELSDDGIVWTLDGIVAVAAVLLVGLLRDDPGGDEHPWALNAFVAAVYAGFVLVLFTGLGPLNLGSEAVLPLDLWLAGMAALTLWGIHRAPPGLQRGWFGRQLAWIVALWIPLGFWTTLEVMDGPAELALVMVGGVGVVAFLYADRTGTREVMTAAALTFVVPTWYWGAERAGALGAVVALALTAALLFWLSGRWGDAVEEGGGDRPGGGGAAAGGREDPVR